MGLPITDELASRLLPHGLRQIADVKKARIAELIAATDFQLLSGGNEELNLLNALSSIA